MRAWLALLLSILVGPACAGDYAPGAVSQYHNLTTIVSVVGNGADTTEDTLQSFTVPANTLNAVGDKLHVVAGGSFGATTDVKTARLRFGGVLQVSAVGNGGGQVAWHIDAWIVKTATNLYSVAAEGSVLNASNGGTAAGSGASLTLTAAQTMAITGQNATTATANSITCVYLQIELVQAP